MKMLELYGKFKAFWQLKDEGHYMTLFTKIILIFLAIFVIWASFAPINSSIIANGEIILTANKKVISHLEGGIIEKIKVCKLGQKSSKQRRVFVLRNFKKLLA
jgi:epimerase transport system membrane fusion protein